MPIILEVVGVIVTTMIHRNERGDVYGKGCKIILVMVLVVVVVAVASIVVVAVEVMVVVGVGGW